MIGENPLSVSIGIAETIEMGPTPIQKFRFFLENRFLGLQDLRAHPAFLSLSKRIAFRSRTAIRDQNTDMLEFAGFLEFTLALGIPETQFGPDNPSNFHVDSYRDERGNTLLHYLAAEGEVIMLSLLLKHIKSLPLAAFSLWVHSTQQRFFYPTRGINPQNIYGETPIHLAVHRQDPSVLKILINEGVTLNMHDRNGDTPTHLAVYAASTDLLKPLIDGGADIELKNGRGDRAVHLAVVVRNAAILRLLINSGADLNVFDANSQTPLDIAWETKATEMAVILIIEGGQDVEALRETRDADAFYNTVKSEIDRIFIGQEQHRLYAPQRHTTQRNVDGSPKQLPEHQSSRRIRRQP